MNKPRELREKSNEQLSFDLAEVQRNLFDLRCKSATERLDKPSNVKIFRREIARIRTILRERELVELYKKIDAMVAEAEAELAVQSSSNAPAV